MDVCGNIFLAETSKPAFEIRVGGARKEQFHHVMSFVDKKNQRFQIKMKNALSEQPMACLSTGCCVCTGYPAWYWRKRTLEALGANSDDYIEDFQCFQGYVTEICFIDLRKFDRRSECFIIESICFPACSLISTRMYIMEQEQMQPDPVDFQIINCSNTSHGWCPCYQLIGNQCADVVSCGNCLTDLCTLTVAGHMGAQIKAELDHSRTKPTSGYNGVVEVDSDVESTVESDDGADIDFQVPDYMHMERDLDDDAENKHVRVSKPVAQTETTKRRMEVDVPEGSAPGTMMVISCPNGKQRMIKIPPGLNPGDTMKVAY